MPESTSANSSDLPDRYKVAAFAFGRGRGVIEGYVGVLVLPICVFDPASFEAAARVSPRIEKKDLNLACAITWWPFRADYFALKRDID
jgi:crossover junction endodeoxyribonuclease RuvC